jgi:hypothetical protein
VRVSQSALTKLLERNAVELKFVRRRPILGSPATRRMLATNDGLLLNSAAGRTALNFRPASGHLKFNPQVKGLVMTWDIFMQDYRLVPSESVDVVSVIPTTPSTEFWNYFSTVLSKMSAGEKDRFMDK